MKNPFYSYLLWCLLFVLPLQVFGQTSKATKPTKSTAKTSAAKVAKLKMVEIKPGQWTIVNAKKQTLYDVFFFDNGPDYPQEGLIRVVKNGKIGYADGKTYAIVIQPQFDCAFPFENGQAKVSNDCTTVKEGEHKSWESKAWQYIDKKGKLRK